MSSIWPKQTEITVTMTALGQKFRAVQVLDPEIAGIEEIRESVIRQLKDAVLQEIGKQAHWRIHVAE